MIQASINIDLDTLADDIDSHGRLIHDDGLPAITYDRVLPRFLELLDRHSIKATFFVIGRDVADHAVLLKRLAADGHELANHTMHHNKQLVNLNKAEMCREIAECHGALSALSDAPIVGFRAPGYTVSTSVIQVLRQLGYRYDTSLNGSLTYSVIKRLFKAVRLHDKAYVTCQPIADHFGPRNPFRLADGHLTRIDAASSFLEIPVSVVPRVHYPFVTSVLLPLGLQPTLWALRQLVARGLFVNCGLHINEFTDPSDVAIRRERFYYTSQLMKRPLAERIHYFDVVFEAIKAQCEIVLLRDVKA
jgi:peptidoglycan/xylan/chitin deacetylase (PgdA/CDA1 family)